MAEMVHMRQWYGNQPTIIWKMEIIIKFVTSIIVKVQSLDDSGRKLAIVWVFEAKYYIFVQFCKKMYLFSIITKIWKLINFFVNLGAISLKGGSFTNIGGTNLILSFVNVFRLDEKRMKHGKNIFLTVMHCHLGIRSEKCDCFFSM